METELEGKMVKIKVVLSKNDVVEWIGQPNDELAELYAKAMANGLARLRPGVDVSVEYGDVYDRHVIVGGLGDAEAEYSLLEELGLDLQAVDNDLAGWGWLPDWAQLS